MRRTAFPGRDPIPETVHVHVHTAPIDASELTGSSYDVDLPVRSRIADEPHFTGTIWIVVTDHGTHVEPKTEAQKVARADDEARVAATRP